MDGKVSPFSKVSRRQFYYINVLVLCLGDGLDCKLMSGIGSK